MRQQLPLRKKALQLPRQPTSLSHCARLPEKANAARFSGEQRVARLTENVAQLTRETHGQTQTGERLLGHQGVSGLIDTPAPLVFFVLFHFGCSLLGF